MTFPLQSFAYRYARVTSVHCGIATALLLCACAGKDKAAAGGDPDDAPNVAHVASADSTSTAKSVAVSKGEVVASLDTVKATSFVETLSNMGTVTSRVGHVALLSAPAPTRVVRVLVAVGDRVRAGANLVELELPAFDAALTSAEASLTSAERSAARAQRLVDAGVAPRKELDVAQADLAAARANAVNARRVRELAHVRSPISGAVTRVNAVLGANVDAGQPLVEIADPSTLDVVLFLSPADVARARIGNTVTLHDGARTDAAPVASGRVTDIAAAVDSANRGVAVRVAVTAPTRTLRLGESLFGTILVQTHARALTVPDAALVPAGEGFRVFVVDTASIAHARDVTVGGRAERRVWITNGLVVGDVVVVHGAYGIDDGARVLRVKP